MISLEQFQADVLATRAKYEKLHPILAGIGVNGHLRYSPRAIRCFTKNV